MITQTFARFLQVDASVPENTKRELIETLNKALPLSQLAVIVNASILVYFLQENFPLNELLIWLSSIIFVVTLRIVLLVIYRLKNPYLLADDHYIVYFTLLTAAVAACLGYAGWCYFESEEPIHLLVLYIILAGITAGAITTLAAITRIAQLYLVIVLIPLIAKSFSINTPEFHLISIISVLFLVVGLGSAARYGKNLRDNMILRSAANEAAKAKTQFIANMSHEIRTPLHGVLGMLQLLEKSTLEKKQKNYLSIAQSSASNLFNIINDILDFSKIENNKIDIEKVQCNIRLLLEDTLKLFLANIHNKHLSLELFYSCRHPDVVVTDPYRLQQILNNLLSNAIKFTDSGYVRIHAEIESSREHPHLKIRVIDSGIGISDQARTRLFQPFEQADNSITRKYGGTGLGLAICKSLIKLMNGEIGFDTNPGGGTIFWIRIPVSIPDQPALALPVPDKHAVLYSRNRFLVDTLTDYLSAYGYRVHTAADPDNIAPTHPTDDLILIDLTSSHDTDIVNLIQQQHQHVVCITHIETNIECEHMLTYPVFREQLRTVLENNISLHNLKTPVTVSSSPSRQLHALLVEDNEVNQMVSSEMIKSCGVMVEIAENGQVACNKVMQQQFDVIFMDCHMPIMDGFEATLEIRKQEAKSNTAPLYIVALTANAQDSEQQRCMEVGMNAFMSKPLVLADLKQLITNLQAVNVDVQHNPVKQKNT